MIQYISQADLCETHTHGHSNVQYYQKGSNECVCCETQLAEMSTVLNEVCAKFEKESLSLSIIYCTV